MTRARAIAGLIAGANFVISAAAHSFLGWKGLGSELAALRPPADLALGLQLGWHFGGVAMLAFGIIVVLLCVKGMRGESVSVLPLMVIAIAYLVFGVWALVASNFNLFFLIFIVPGLLLMFAAWA